LRRKTRRGSLRTTRREPSQQYQNQDGACRPRSRTERAYDRCAGAWQNDAAHRFPRLTALCADASRAAFLCARTGINVAYPQVAITVRGARLMEFVQHAQEVGLCPPNVQISRLWRFWPRPLCRAAMRSTSRWPTETINAGIARRPAAISRKIRSGERQLHVQGLARQSNGGCPSAANQLPHRYEHDQTRRRDGGNQDQPTLHVVLSRGERADRGSMRRCSASRR
jgi:hypothetical protein